MICGNFAPPKTNGYGRRLAIFKCWEGLLAVITSESIWTMAETLLQKRHECSRLHHLLQLRVSNQGNRGRYAATTVTSHYVHHRHDCIETHHGKMDSITRPLGPKCWGMGRSLWPSACLCNGGALTSSEFFKQMGQRLAAVDYRRASRVSAHPAQSRIQQQRAQDDAPRSRGRGLRRSERSQYDDALHLDRS